MTNVLIVEDEQAIRRFLRAALEGDGCARYYRSWYITTWFHWKYRHAATSDYSRLGLPDGGGIDFIRDLRPVGAIPVIVLSARGRNWVRGAELMIT